MRVARIRVGCASGGRALVAGLCPLRVKFRMPAPSPHVMAGPDPAIDTGTIGPVCLGTRIVEGGWTGQAQP